MKLDALDHPKTFDFAARLQVELPTAIGYLELLWAFTGKQAPQGNIGKWPDGSIARACFWMGTPSEFIIALCESGLIDADQEHRYLVHDWPEHAPRWVRAKLAKLGLSFIQSVEGTKEPTTDDDKEGNTEPSLSVVKCSEGKSSEGKGSEEKARSRDLLPPASEGELPPGLNPTAWHRWKNYRIEIRKPLKPASIPAAQKALAAYGSDQEAVVEQSIANGWQGLFALKGATGRPAQSNLSAHNLSVAERWAKGGGNAGH